MFKRTNDKGISEVKKIVNFKKPAGDVFRYMAYYPHVKLVNKHCSHLKLESEISSRVQIWHQVIKSPVPLVSS